MERDGCNQHVVAQNRFGRAVQPLRGRSRQIKPVTMFQGEHHLPAIPLVQQGGPPLRPWPGNGQAFIAVFGVVRILAGQGHPALIANQPADKGRFAPTCAAKTKIRCHLRIASEALWRIDQAQGRLQFHRPPGILCGMTQPPLLTDRPTLVRNRARATATFLQHEAITEVQERLVEVNRRFTKPAVVTGFPALWAEFLPGTVVVPDDDVLGLTQGQHDLVIHAMALHWANDPVGQLVQCRHALQPDGLFLAVMFGGQTLHELRSCLAQAEAEVAGGISPRILPMGEIRDLGGLLQRAGFALPVADSFTKTVLYRDPAHLMRDLRAMGEGNALAARLRHPTRRTVFARAIALYLATFATADGLIPATFELIVLTGWAPADSQQKPLRPGSAAQRLADALGTVQVPLPKG
jgi:hypothetical protein